MAKIFVNRRRPRFLPTVALLFLSGVSTGFAQGTSFTYQGRLNDGGAPANGNYDLQFALWDTASAGTQIGSTQTLSSVPVNAGSFTVTLDFGAAAFPGANRFLEIGVRPTGGSTFTTLSPRQQISSTPYALRSFSSASADGLSSACAGCVQDSNINSIAGNKVSGTIAVTSVPTGSSNYIQNTANMQASSNFNISGNGNVGGNFITGSGISNGGFTVDQGNTNSGQVSPGLNLGGGGEGIASKRTSGGNQFGLDLYTNFLARMSITNGGDVGVGTTNPNGLQVNAAVSETPRTVTNVRFGVSSGTPRAIFEYAVSNGTSQWEIDNFNGDFRILYPGTVAFEIDATGDAFFNNYLTVSGELRVGSLGLGGNPLCFFPVGNSNLLTNCSSSSLRYKKDLLPFRGGLSILNRLRPITFTWKDRPERDLGLGAEDVAAVEPLLTFRNAKGEIEGVKYDKLTVVLINSIKEQQKEIEILRTANTTLNARLQAVEKRMQKRGGTAPRPR